MTEEPFHYKILVAEDDILYRTLIKKIIESLGYECIEAGNGKIGLELFNKENPHLVISDIQMPEINGIEFLTTVRKLKPDTIFVAMTFFDSEEWAIKALNAGANNYLKKPVQKEELIHLLKKYYTIAFSRTISKNIDSMVVNRQFELKFKSSLELVPVVVEYLVKECGLTNTSGIELGLNEIINNSVEHGNLAISYHEKSQALDNGNYEKLFIERLANPVFANKSVTINFTSDKNYTEWIITDEGDGFNWQNIPDPMEEEYKEGFHGRGIFLSRFQFDELEYLGKGNVVRLRKYKKAD